MAIFLHTVEEIFRDYSGRRTGILRALTNEVDHFFQLCDPDKENLCLFGHPNESWEVKEPASDVPTELPEPVLGINYPRDEVPREVWLSLIAAHSDSWLLSLAFFHSARASLGRDERRYLFSLINEQPTIFEVVTRRKPIQDKPRMAGGSKSEASSSRKRSIDRGKMKIDHDLCGSCGRKYSADEFWIFCYFCQRWYHGMCVKMTPSKGKSIKKYKCPSCSIDKALCRSCGGEYKEDGVWIFCDDCQRWFHGMCVNITPAKAKSIKQYKCPYCSLKGMPW